MTNEIDDDGNICLKLTGSENKDGLRNAWKMCCVCIALVAYLHFINLPDI